MRIANAALEHPSNSVIPTNRWEKHFQDLMACLVHNCEVPLPILLYAFLQIAFNQNSFSIEEIDHPGIIVLRQFYPYLSIGS